MGSDDTHSTQNNEEGNCQLFSLFTGMDNIIQKWL